ncbi:MAG: GNAT family N-acetyltransferase, partial [Gemmatimonadales bacterium]
PLEVTPEPAFRNYQAADRDACLGLFDANCPAFFAPNERADYLEFLSSVDGYQLCLLSDRIVGGYGLLPAGAGSLALRWILLAPTAQGRGLGSIIMARVMETLRARQATSLYIGASHKSAPFFARFGASELTTTLDGWGPGMHRVDMTLVP